MKYDLRSHRTTYMERLCGSLTFRFSDLMDNFFPCFKYNSATKQNILLEENIFIQKHETIKTIDDMLCNETNIFYRDS